MMLTQYFDLSRFWLLLKLELFRSIKAILMTFVITFGLLFFVGLLLDIVVDPHKTSYTHHENYAPALMLGGFILSSLAFSDLSGTLRRYNYLTLPVSAFEKFLSMWLLTAVGWIVVFTFSFTAYTWLVNAIGHLIAPDTSFLNFDPASSFAIETMKYYFVLQGIFLVGAAHFKGYVFPKTVLFLLVGAMVFAALAYVIMGDLFLSEHRCSNDECEIVDEIAIHPLWGILKGFFWWILAPLCWVITYFGIKEKEVQRGVQR